MTPSPRRRTAPVPRPARDRRRAVERLLTRESLLRGPRPVAGPGRASDGTRRPWAARLAAVLAELGPVLAAFGRHLAERPDLLGTGDRRLLAEGLPDAAPPAEPGAVAELFRAELGRDPDQLFARFDPAPARSRLLEQVHRARLPGGGEVLVRLIRPEVGLRLEEDLALLSVLEPAFEPVLPASFPFAELSDAFRADLAGTLDLGARAGALEALRPLSRPGAATARERELPLVPAVHARLSSRRVLTTDAVEAGPAPASGAAARERARALHRAWLRLAGDGLGVVVAGEAGWLPDGRPVLPAPRLAAGGEGPLRGFLEYLAAVAAHEPDRAFALLARDLEPTPRAIPEAELARRIRQAVPFGDSAVAGGDTVSDHVLLHWRLARECGYRPSAHLEACYRGLLWAVGAAGTGAPEDRDPLRDALEDVAWRSGWDDLRALGSPERLWAALEGHAGALATLPATLERAVEALERIDEGRRPAGEAAARAGPGGSAAVLVALGLAMVAVAVLSGEASAAGAAWAEIVGGAAFLGLGGLLLRFAGGT